MNYPTFNDWMGLRIWLEEEVQPQVVHLPDTLNIPREEMPQIKGKHVDKFFDFLGKKKQAGQKPSPEEVLPGSLRPTQSQINMVKVNNYIKDPCSTGLFTKRILVSQDNYIIDGHHHWMAFMRGFPNRPMPVWKVPADIKTALTWAKKFPKTQYQQIGAD